MKKKVLVASVLVAVAQLAQAQSSNVTVYGLLDMGVILDTKANKNGDQQLTMGSVMATSRLGFRGQEDLGQGLSAVFNLENGFKPENGAQSRTPLFDRKAVVGIKSASLGMIELGRNTNAGNDYAGQTITNPLGLAFDTYDNKVTKTSSKTGGYIGSGQMNLSSVVVGNTNMGASRSDNMIKYTYDHATGNLILGYAPGGVAGDSSAKSSWTIGIKQSFAGVTGAYSHFEAQDSNAKKLKYDSFGATTTISGIKLTAGRHVLKGDAGYNFATSSTVDTNPPNLSITSGSYPGAPGVTYTSGGEFKVTVVGVGYDFTPKYNATLAYSAGSLSGGKTGDISSTVLVNKYSLSKRTYLYGVVGRTTADSAIVDTATYSTSNTVYIAGVVHTF